jgi:hypothetical protein
VIPTPPKRPCFSVLSARKSSPLSNNPDSPNSPRLEGPPYFYAVQNEEYATQIARDWNAKAPEIGAECVTRFRVQTDSLTRFELRTVGGAIHQDYWIPVEDLPEFNQHIVGTIEIIAEFRGPQT